MRIIALLNRGGGTLRTTDLDALEAHLREAMQAGGHTIDIRFIDGEAVGRELEAAAGSPNHDAVLAGGGDGTISAAAAALMGSGKTLLVLPAGTMNLFARALGLPMDLHKAVDALAGGVARDVDIATADGRPFVHQFSVGLHARMVLMRSRFEYASRLGKMLASLRAAYAALAKPSTIEAELVMGEAVVRARTPGIGISNNLFGDGPLPIAEKPDGGLLGIYIFRTARRLEIALLFVAMMLGRWKEIETVDIHQSEEVVLRVRSRRRNQTCVIDGELMPASNETTLRIHPKALRVMVPAGNDQSKKRTDGQKRWT